MTTTLTRRTQQQAAVSTAAVDAPAAAGWRVNPLLLTLAVLILAVSWRQVPGLVIFLGILSALVAIHEGAHLLVARWRGMHASEYAIGFGPRIVAGHIGELEVAWRLFPIGGFVKISGMRHTDEVDPALEARTYRAASLPSKLAVVFAGPAANLVAGFAIAVVALGFVAPPEMRSDNPVAAAADWSVMLVTVSFEGYGQLVSSIGEYPEMIATQGQSGDGARVLSPVSGSQLSEQATAAGLVWLLLLASVISIALGAFNALPLPPLDGGHALVAVVEKVGAMSTGRPFVLSIRAQNLATYALLAFLVALSLASVYLDVVAPHANPFT
jgi:membrane-associated protease RseP (regulator of RpoE activity)